jgi:hypothetical protein
VSLADSAEVGPSDPLTVATLVAGVAFVAVVLALPLAAVVALRGGERA